MPPTPTTTNGTPARASAARASANSTRRDTAGEALRATEGERARERVEDPALVRAGAVAGAGLQAAGDGPQSFGIRRRRLHRGGVYRGRRRVTTAFRGRRVRSQRPAP